MEWIRGYLGGYSYKVIYRDINGSTKMMEFASEKEARSYFKKWRRKLWNY